MKFFQMASHYVRAGLIYLATGTGIPTIRHHAPRRHASHLTTVAAGKGDHCFIHQLLRLLALASVAGRLTLSPLAPGSVVRLPNQKEIVMSQRNRRKTYSPILSTRLVWCFFSLFLAVLIGIPLGTMASYWVM
jgi:hypothetical protein